MASKPSTTCSRCCSIRRRSSVAGALLAELSRDGSPGRGGTRIIPTKAEEGFRLDLDLLEQQITPTQPTAGDQFPGNPSGQVMTWAELEAWPLVAVTTQLMVMSDEI